jgi:DNA helicase HerA-like ATPase
LRSSLIYLHKDYVRRVTNPHLAAIGGDPLAADPAHEPGRILIGKSDTNRYLTLALGNRHGLVALFGQTGHPVRARISDMGPLLLARLLKLNDIQEGVLNIGFRLADEEGLLLIDLKDLRAPLHYLGESAAEVPKRYGNVAPSTIGAIQRRLLVLENQGAAGLSASPSSTSMIFCGPAQMGAVSTIFLAPKN